LAKEIAEDAAADRVTGHPLDISLALAERRPALVARVSERLGLPEPFPPLAVLLAASPLEAALFDAHGKAVGQSAFALLGPESLPHDLGTYLGKPFAGLSLQQFVSPQPVAALPLYHLVGALDPLVDADVTSPVGDGLPETLAEWIPRDGLSHLKIKLAGDDLAWDVARVRAVNATADRSGQSGQAWAFSLDFNERCEDADYVLAMLDQVEASAPQALRRIQYIEQPTHRDLAAHPENTMHRVAERLPVVIDESLVDLDSLYLAREQGYSGVALKACKGHAEALLMGAAAQHLGMYLCVQDLTCIGASFLHSASLAAHIPTVAAIESNGRQYCPAGNDGWRDRYPGMFDVQGGQVPTACLDEPGLGYREPDRG
jgi:L-alanine-DL-glutamate epimerase-like enolase superfamily enzyme